MLIIFVIMAIDIFLLLFLLIFVIMAIVIVVFLLFFIFLGVWLSDLGLCLVFEHRKDYT